MADKNRAAGLSRLEHRAVEQAPHRQRIGTVVVEDAVDRGLRNAGGRGRTFGQSASLPLITS